jgi:hypothetical protein
LNAGYVRVEVLVLLLDAAAGKEHAEEVEEGSEDDANEPGSEA